MPTQLRWLSACALGMSLMAAGCERNSKGSGDNPVSSAPAGSPASPQAGGPAAKSCGARDEPVMPGVTAKERCNAWDDDCDGKIDEGFDHDGDGHTTCGLIDREIDCDDENPAIYPGHAELCDDDLDNNCNWRWNEDCPIRHCGIDRACPDGLECIDVGHACIEPKACSDVQRSTTPCDGLTFESDAEQCDPTQCDGWESGTCWANCDCAADGVYRWIINCTE